MKMGVVGVQPEGGVRVSCAEAVAWKDNGKFYSFSVGDNLALGIHRNCY